MFEQFMKKNKIKKEIKKYAPTKSLLDEKGNPLKWEFKAISTIENEKLRDECTTEVPVKGKYGQSKIKLDTNLYIAKLITACTVVPDLNNKALQDSYGVYGSVNLLRELVDNPGEYTELTMFIQELNGFTDINEEVEEAKK